MSGYDRECQDMTGNFRILQEIPGYEIDVSVTV